MSEPSFLRGFILAVLLSFVLWVLGYFVLDWILSSVPVMP